MIDEKNIFGSVRKKLNIIHGKFVLKNNALKEFYDMEEEIKNSNDK